MQHIEKYPNCPLRPEVETAADFLGVDLPELLQTPSTERDPTGAMYAGFVKNAVLPQEYLDRIYESRFA